MQFRDFIAQRETILAGHYYTIRELLILAKRHPALAVEQMQDDSERTSQRLEALRQEMHSTITADGDEDP